MAATWLNNKRKHGEIAKEIEPAAMLVTKDHIIWTILWWIATVFTFGLFAIGMPRKIFLEEYATTLIFIQGYPNGINERLLVHECRHVTHCVWLGYLIPIVGWIPGIIGRRIRACCGFPIYMILYLFFIFPIFFSIGRLLIELDADRASWIYQIKNEYKSDQIIEQAERFGETVCSKCYLWSWPKFLGGVYLYELIARKTIKKWTR